MTHENQQLRTLADLKPGERGIVAQVGGEGALHRHLLDMGITPGVSILLQKTAPMGDPLELHLRGYALTLRVDDARKIVLRGDDEDVEDTGYVTPNSHPQGLPH